MPKENIPMKARRVFQLVVLKKAELRSTMTTETDIHVPTLSAIVEEAEKMGIPFRGNIDDTDVTEWKNSAPEGQEIVVAKRHWFVITGEDGPNSGRYLGDKVLKVTGLDV